MKKIVVLLVAVSAFATTQAQIQFGVKAGLNLSTFSGKGVEDAKFKPGFNAGALVSVPITSSFSVQPELQYSLQGAKGSENNVTMSDNLSYVNVPVLVKYNHSSGFFIQTGPQLGILLSAKEKIGTEKSDIKQYLNSTDFSWVFGLGFLTSANLGIDARYNLGFSNIAKDSGSDKIKNGVIQVGLFYLFGEHKKSK